MVLSGLTQKVCHVYLDDVLVFGHTFKEHVQNLCSVLDQILRARLRLKPKKCCIGQTSMEYLGHVVSADGVRTEEVRQFPPPTDVKTLRPFLVLASYYQRFVPGFSETAEPLYTKEVEFIWSAECQEVFDRGTGVVTYTEVCRLQVSFYSGDGRVRE